MGANRDRTVLIPGARVFESRQDRVRADRYLHVMTVHPRPRALAAALLLLTGLPVLQAVADVAPVTVAALDTPWTTPTRPAECTPEQALSGDVSGCLLAAHDGTPAEHGWPTPPFPTADDPVVLPWVPLTIGSTGAAVSAVQQALVDRGASLDVDGQFGPITANAVAAFQTAQGLRSTGVVNERTANRLGVQNIAGGAFPGTGWDWLGWGYNGSPALADWEAQFVANTDRIGSMRAGSLRTFADALPLFEGFYREIQERGYVIGDGGTYVFRCTATTSKDCENLQPGNLSFHAFGLATDINTAANPLITYVARDGISACAVPMKTDIPRWVVRVAEKWGLYWGGYGWGNGCTSPSQYRTVALRDPMHFEFDGTPAMARAILLHNESDGCFEVVDAAGTPSVECPAAGETPAASTRTVVRTGAPAGASAALVNITATGALTSGYVSTEACGPAPASRTSVTNARPGRAVAATTVVELDADGAFCLYQSAAMHLVVDVQGFFAPSATTAGTNLFTPVSTRRTLDTATRSWCTPDSECLAPSVVPAATEVVNTAASPVAAVATLATITARTPATGGYVAADTCDGLRPDVKPSSNLNFAAGDVAVANLAVAPSSSTEQGVQFCTWSPATLHERIAVHGFFAPAALGGLGYAPAAPERLVDTRQCRIDPVSLVESCAVPATSDTVIRLAAPAEASVVLVNLTTTNAANGGQLVAGTCADIAAGRVRNASVHAVPGAAVASLAPVRVGADGMICLRTSRTMDVIADLVGTFAPGAPLGLLPVSPTRVHDSRTP